MSFLDLPDIDPHNPDVAQRLEPLQGNILKGHGRGHSVHYFFQFTREHARNKELLQHLAPLVTSAAQQERDRAAARGSGFPGRPFCTVALTARGYRALGYSDSDIARAFSEPPGPDPIQPAVTFKKGMAFHRAQLGDPPIDRWEPGYADSRPGAEAQIFDGMVSLANASPSRLEGQEEQLLEILGTGARVLVVERGRAFYDDHGHTLEHFGYVDGRSQPIFYKADFEKEQQDEGAAEWDPRANPGLVLVPDLLAPDDQADMYFGSYLVFRKLEQNVRGFKAREHELAEALGLEGDSEELAGALAVGRFEDGTPVVLRPVDGLTSPVPNDFRYDTWDPDGHRCPLHAHIRKVNPRKRDPASLSHRIARRGITYGEREIEPKDEPEGDELPEGGVGLLFMCFQASIDNQFAYLQRHLANRLDDGLDPMIGQSDKTIGLGQPWPVHWAEPYRKPFDLSGFVTMLGGDFFFAPSIAFLRNPR